MVTVWRRFSRSVGCGGLILAFLDRPNPAVALTITPAFDLSITSAANALPLEAAINSAIGIIGSLYANPGAVGIVFTQAAGNFLAQSQTADYGLSYATYIDDLSRVSRVETANRVLATAIANLSAGNKPGAGGSVLLTSADARVALGLPKFSGCYNGSGTFVSQCGQSYDGVITLSISQTLNYDSAPTSGAYSVINTIEHEVNEILGGGGQGTVLNQIFAGNSAYSNDLGVLDLYRYSAPGVASFSTSSAASSYFSVDGGANLIVGFNQNSTGDYADFSGGNTIQSAFINPGSALPYDALSPEFAMLESIGYAGAVLEPTSLAVLVTGMASLGAARRMARLIQ